MPFSDYLDDSYIYHDENGNIIDEDEDILICPHTDSECSFCYSCRRGYNV